MSANTGLWLGVLGPLHVRVDGVVVPVTAGRQRAVLGTLLVRPNEVVSFEELADVVWDGSPPKAARATVRNYVRRLRRALGTGFADRIITRDPGYLFRVDEGELDRLTFAGLCRAGHVAVGAGDWERASDVLGRALGLWRGPALVDVSPEVLHRDEVPALEQLRLQATEWRIEADMHLGRHEVLVDELRLLLVRYPLHERLHAQLMLALARSGRRAEAMEAYRQARRLIVDELGIEPGQDLSDLHQQILRADPGLDCRPIAGGAPDGHPTRPVPEVPHQLPAPVRHFTGRAGHLEVLSGLVGEGAGDAATVVISAVDGMAGVGKTALALHMAHRLSGHYPDGQLFVDLHGFTEGVAPVAPGAALEAMLRALGVAGERIPDGVEDRAALFRTRLAGRRVLIVLDNAASEAQVRPLLPGGPGCLVLITSRRRLAGLDDVELLSLDVLPVPEAVALFARTVGPDRVAAADAAVVGQIVELCGRLPLAIRIAAARLRHRPDWTVDRLATLLGDEHGPLAALRAGERSVAASVHLSYADLDSDQQRMFRMLGLHPGSDTDRYAAAALAGRGVDQADRLLEDLCDAHVLDQPSPERYRLHDLVRAHASHLAHTQMSEQDRDAALMRLFGHYTHAASAAARMIHPHETRPVRTFPPPATPVPVWEGPAGAARWLDGELSNLLVVASRAAGSWPAVTVALSAVLHPHLDARARYTDAETLHHAALTAARGTGDRHGELTALTCLGNTEYRQGRHRSTDTFERALRIAGDLHDRHGEMLALIGLGNVHHQRAHHDQATRCLVRALSVARNLHVPSGEVRALFSLGNVHLARGRFEQATRCFERALDAATAIGYRSGELVALIGLGRAHLLQARYGQASRSLERALRLAGDIGDRTGELNALLSLGPSYRSLGRHEQCVDCLERAMRIAGATGHRNGELVALTGLAVAHYLRGRHEQAAACYEQAIPMARDLRAPISEILSLTGLGNIHRARARHQQAVDCFEQAQRLAGEIDYGNGRFEVLHGLGRVHHDTGQPERARAEHQAALDLAGDLDQPGDQARAHDGLAHAHLSLGHPEQARRHWQRALDMLAGLGLADVEEIRSEDIRAHLHTLAQQPAVR